MRFLVVGSGRSGTGYCASLFNSAGIKCGHQSIFRHEHTLGKPYDWGDYEGGSSFEAVPLLCKITKEPVRVVAVLRHPLKVIASYVGLGMFGDDMREKYDQLSLVLDLFFPQVLEQRTPIERAAEFWMRWNAEAIRYADAVLKLEEMTPKKLFEAAGQPYKSNRGPLDRNLRRKLRQVEVWWDDIPNKDVRSFAEFLGYT